MLPIEPILPHIMTCLTEPANVVLEAPTGAGKTTCVPPALLDTFGSARGTVILLEPRRLAARAAAQRMARQRGQEVGEEIGYQVRFERRVSSRTRIVAVTEGILLRRLLDDPYLEDVSFVLLDEFHERRLDSDLILAMLRLLQTTVRPDLRLIAMSATLPASSLVEYLDPCRLVRGEGRLYPVAIEYRPRAPGDNLAQAAARAVRDEWAGCEGDILVFLPGRREIRQTERYLEDLAARAGFDIVPLYGDLPMERQSAALRQGPRRRVVLATNVAETSVTVEGVMLVIDTGYEKQLAFHPTTGLDYLATVPISRASAAQRAGRAGRLAPGRCIRLWGENEERRRPDHLAPEIQRLDLAHAALAIASWGQARIDQFPWYEPPPKESIERAMHLLVRLGAWKDGHVTSLGRRMASLPVHPRVARLLLAGIDHGNLRQAALAAALLSERAPFQRDEVRMRAPALHTRSDLLDQVEALERFEGSGATHGPRGTIAPSMARNILRVRDHLVHSVEHERLSERKQRSGGDEGLLRAIFAAYPDRLARRRAPGERRAVMENGRGVILAPESGVMKPELFVCIDVDQRPGDSLVRIASEVDRAWLPEDQFVTTTDIEYDPAADRVIGRRRRYWGELLLDEHPAPVPDRDQADRVLLEAARRRTDAVWPVPDSEAARLVVRLRCLRQWLPELDLPACDEPWLESWLPALCAGCRSLAEVRETRWTHVLRTACTPTQWQTLAREAPEKWTSPKGRSFRLQYCEGRPPVLAVRLQELFGIRQTPCIARGRVRVLLHLLAPNFRPVQITDDLASFWKNIYPRVRQELRRRYPKHDWPEL